MLKEMVHASGAKSTQPLDEESVDDLTDKCQEVSKEWAKTADRLWVTVLAKREAKKKEKESVS